MPARSTNTRKLHLAVAEKILAELESGLLASDDVLPSESALAARYRVARGTVHRALEHIATTHHRLSRRGARWIMHPTTLAQDVTQLRSFGQWAKAIGHRPGGRTVSSVEGRSTEEEAHALGIGLHRPVLRITRLQSLDGAPVMVKRTTFPQWLIPTIARVPPDASSIMEVVEHVHGPQLAHGEHVISAVLPDTEDARLLGVPRSTPLLRIQRTARTFDGRPFEYSDDRYLSTATSLSIVNSARQPTRS
ncbi:GntR family transcriptional regulator [Microbacterium sp. M28]|uniref:GntR family transcriptional regulator n=1 Tax=Microbacterium sp. M28 TaxID=2962064 RepID=UPI0021F4A74D|nr:GntR family transcriptional regulator [Microbacterium sp. M28]UYO96284.1 GntR family transcriptional regulator [Microbacterium sp. M28]